MAIRPGCVWIFSILLAVPAASQLTPNAAVGFRPEGVYELNGLDQVSIFNGGLGIAGIPLGIPLRTSSNLSLQLVLSYSSSAWEAVPTSCSIPPGGICGSDPSPRKQDLAGLGWRVSISELYQPPTAAGVAPNRWVFADSDGSQHTLYPTLHPDDIDEDAGGPFEFHLLQPTMYSRDGSFNRISCDRPTASTYGDCWAELGSNGETRHFHNAGTQTAPLYRIEQLSDRFGNTIDIEYLSSPTRWRITDSHNGETSGREIVLRFDSTAFPKQPLHLAYIDFPCFSSLTTPGANCDGTTSPTARWNFAYATKAGVFPPTVYGSSPPQMDVEVLTSLTLPNGSRYSTPTSSYHPDAGRLMSLTLPTLGRIEWDWGAFNFPAIRTEACNQPLPPDAQYWTEVSAIVQRRQYDLNDSLLGTWSYARLSCPNPEDPTSCPADEQTDPETGAAEKLTVTVESPLNDVSQYYFSIFPGQNLSCVEPIWGTGILEYGLPYTRKIVDPLGGGRFLSEEHYDCPEGTPNPNLDTCTLLKTVYQSFETDGGSGAWSRGEINDRNRRMLSRRTVFNDDANRYKLVENADFDGLGHYRAVTTSSDILPLHDRTVATNINHDRGTWPSTWTEFPPNLPWLLNKFDWRKTEETGVDQCDEGDDSFTQYAWEEFCFDDETGFLDRQRTLRRSEDVTLFPIVDNLPRAANDVVRVFKQDPGTLDGNVRLESWHGGDDGFQLDTELLLCSVSQNFGPPDFQAYHQYEFGTRARSRFTDSDDNTSNDPPAVQHYLWNVTIDGRTGLVRSSSDVSDITTKYLFDTTNRLRSALPAASNGLAAECYVYSNAVGSTRGKVAHTSSDGTTCAGSALAGDEYHFDGLGRLVQERRRTAATAYDDRFSGYDKAGNRNFTSEWTRNESEIDAKKYGRELANLDPFGRPGIIRHKFLVNGNPQTEVEATLTYKGEREIKRTKSVASVLSGVNVVTEPVDSYERYDDNGKLSEVEEHSVGGLSRVHSFYSYDVGGRLKRSETDPSGISSDQVRCWDYDQRGFLLAEEHPELVGPTDPTPSLPEPPAVDDARYSEFDAMGHAKRSSQGISSLNPPPPANDGPEIATQSFEYDLAARLRKVFDLRTEPGSSDDRLLKEWQYATSNSGANRRKGKVETAYGHNFPVLGGVPVSITFKETSTYAENGGARSSRKVDAFLNGTQNIAFQHFEDIDALGQRNRIDYPKCVEPGGGPFCDASSMTSLITTNHYTYGLLDQVPGWASSITHHAGGLWNTITHQSGVIDQQTLGADRRQRPKLLKTILGANTLWKSGTYLYDPSGNIYGMGSTAVGDETNELGGTDKFLYDRVERLKHAWLTVSYSAPPPQCLFCDGFSGGNTCSWSATTPPPCSVLETPGSIDLVRTDEQEYDFDTYGNINNVHTWYGGVEQPIRVTTTNPLTNRLYAPLAIYDSRGNVNTYSATAFAFDRLNRLVRRNAPGENPYHFLYTADDERIVTLVEQPGYLEQHWSLRDFGGKVLREFGTQPLQLMLLRRAYIHRGQSPLAALDQEDYEFPEALHYAADHLGTPRLETSSTGAVAHKWKYFPFGEEAIASSQTGTALRFTSHERDRFNLLGPADDYDYMHARFHSPLTGRMLSVDPVMAIKRSMKRPQAWNRYAYVMGNPLKYTDPTGETFQIGGCEAGMVDQCMAGRKILNGSLGASASQVRVNVDGTVSLAKGVSASAFASQGDFQKGLLTLIGHKSTFTLIAGSSSEASAGGGGQTVPTSGGGANIFIDPSMFPTQTGSVQGTANTTFAHELGHALGRVFPSLYSRLNAELGMYTRTQLNEGYAVTFENRYRASIGADIRLAYDKNLPQDVYVDPDVDLFP